ncbi:MAG: phosphoenolpyruvate synthase, partial [Deltaproteobacteria bacterium HGW-Deltaproteobacteria-11]
MVWQIDDLVDYAFFVEPFVERATGEGRKCVYLRFAPHPPVLEHRPGLEVVELDPGEGFDCFSRDVHRIIEERGKEVFYIFDNLSALVVEWATDELLANFFQVTCPFLFELDTVAYFALIRGRHSNSMIARIRDTTQVLIDVYRIDGQTYIHPLKVWDRYSPQMFLPHVVAGSRWSAVSQSGDAAAVSAMASKFPLRGASASIAPWDSIYNRLAISREYPSALDEAAPETKALKNELCRMLFGHRPEFNRLAEELFGLDDLFEIRERVVGSGMIGGKAAGMLLARCILAQDAENAGLDLSRVLEAHDSFYIGSDVFFTFLVENNLFRLRMELTSDSRLTYEEFEEV